MLVVHSSEIVLKGKNRKKFEEKMARNLSKLLGTNRVVKKGGKFLCFVDPTEEQTDILSVFPGVDVYYTPETCAPDIEEIKKCAAEIVKRSGARSFKIDASRTDKSFPLNSLEINREVGAHVAKETGARVEMKAPEVVVRIDVMKEFALLTDKTYKGPGGLPVSVSGKVVALLSGGIDSPVAAWMMMRRGCKVVLAHFLNRTTVMSSTEDKIVRLAERLAKIQLGGTLYVVPFEKVQSLIIQYVPPKYRTLIYRRSMIRMGNEIARREGAKAIVTGDSVGQVASQTLDNLMSVYAASRLPVYPPLIGMNKEETKEIARKIGTYDISILPYDDCCVYLVSRYPETAARPDVLDSIEEKIEGLHEAEREAVENARIITF